MNTLNWRALTHNNPYTLISGEGLILMPENDRATISLPANPEVGDSVGFLDAGGTFKSQPLTISPNENRINKTASESYNINTNDSVVQLIFTGSIYGWKLLTPVQAKPFAKSLIFSVSGFYEDSLSITDEYLVWLLNPSSAGRIAQLPALEGNTGLYFMLINVSATAITIRPQTGDKIVGVPGDYTLAGQSAMHIIATAETDILGWVLTSKNSLV